MKKIYFRILAICLSLVLTFSILYKDSIQAEALEWVGVAVGYDTALKFLLGLLGVSVGVGVAQEVDWGTLRENAIQVQLDQGNSQAEVSSWWSDVIHGSLDTTSSCWSSFKDWVIQEIGGSTGGSISGNDIVDKLASYTYSNSTIDLSNIDVSTVVSGFVAIHSSGSYIFLFTEKGELVYPSSSYPNEIRFDVRNYSNSSYRGNDNILSFNAFRYGSWQTTLNIISDVYYYNMDVNSSNSKLHEITDLSVDPVYSPLEALYPNIGDIALNPENADTLSTDVIPLPWENIGASDTAIEDVIDDAISKVNDGTMSLENYWEYIQNITNTYAYSIENNYLLPNENGEDKKADDKVKENSENGAFILYGLEKVFPFCIPFDIYAFITLLKADPVAPVIEYPIYNPVTQENEIITIDFSEWESVVIIFRYIFDFLLIIGLLLLARPLVGAGGDS